MKRLMFTICLLLIVLSGCSSMQTHQGQYAQRERDASEDQYGEAMARTTETAQEAGKVAAAPGEHVNEEIREIEREELENSKEIYIGDASKSGKIIEVRKPAKAALENISINELLRIKGINERHIRTGPGMEYKNDDTGELAENEELYVLEERNGWIRFRTSPKDVGWSAWIRKDLTVLIGPYLTELEKLQQWVQSGLAEGVFHSVNVEDNEVRMDPGPWSSLPVEHKQTFVTCFSRYFDLKGSTGRVTILSKYSDEKLATYSVWTGVKIHK